ncbi:hypothetical protein BOX15_Mlig023664g1 [Macrostomum lignano]|uniref:Uncharacterized protein n=2 Tax=Macrostomum lignano TaxID=282301 RepID=A0A267DXB2_9PLAT|nr:hypothetical protein BOX15_Mlig023664g1 [Macrostomum lignano]
MKRNIERTATPPDRQATYEADRVAEDDSTQQQQEQQAKNPGAVQRPRTALEVARSSGMFKDYLAGLDNLRSIVNDCENRLAQALNEFYGTTEKDEQMFNAFNIEVNKAFEACNSCLDKAGHQAIIVDGQAPIATLVNKLKEYRLAANPEDTQLLLQFWESFKLALEQLQTIADDYERRVLSKLRTGCLIASSGAMATAKSPLSKAYEAEAAAYSKELETVRTRVRLLCHSAGTHMRMELLGKASHTERVLINCNDDFYPILCVVPDLTVKLESMARIAYQWLDKDETYLFEVSRQLRDKRSETREMEQQLRAEREKHRLLLKSVKSAYLMCQNSKKRLREITQELKNLEEHIEHSARERRAKMDEKKQKKEMADFLDLSITQTKMNYALQLKRQRLMAQIQELEEFLRKVEQEISSLKTQIQTKTNEKKSAEDLYQAQDSNFANMKTDLEGYTKKVQEMSNELRGVRQHLSHLESIQSLKTSPETVDTFYERPRSVKLAPSLMESINMKKRRLLKQSVKS